MFARLPRDSVRLFLLCALRRSGTPTIFFKRFLFGPSFVAYRRLRTRNSDGSFRTAEYYANSTFETVRVQEYYIGMVVMAGGEVAVRNKFSIVVFRFDADVSPLPILRRAVYIVIAWTRLRNDLRVRNSVPSSSQKRYSRVVRRCWCRPRE